MNVFVAIVYNYYKSTECLGLFETREEAVNSCVKHHEEMVLGIRKRMFSAEPEPVNVPDLRKKLIKLGKYSFCHDEWDSQDRYGVKFQRNYKIYFVQESKGEITDGFVLIVQNNHQPANLECFVSSTRNKVMDAGKFTSKMKSKLTGSYWSGKGKEFFITEIKNS